MTSGEDRVTSQTLIKNSTKTVSICLCFTVRALMQKKTFKDKKETAKNKVIKS